MTNEEYLSPFTLHPSLFTLLSVRCAPSGQDLGHQFPVPVGVAPEIGEVEAAVAGEHHELVAERIESEAGILARGRDDGGVDLRPVCAVPVPHVIGVDLNLI